MRCWRSEIAPEFYDRDEAGIPRAWVARVRNSMARLTEQFSSDRMVREYVEQAYLPAAQAYLAAVCRGRQLARDAGKLAGPDRRRSGNACVSAAWPCSEADDQWHFEVQVILGGLGPDCVQVQLYADPPAAARPCACPCSAKERMHGVVNGHIYRAAVSAQRPAEHFTPRIVPYHPDAFVPMETTRTVWQG